VGLMMGATAAARGANRATDGQIILRWCETVRRDAAAGEAGGVGAAGKCRVIS